MRFGGLPGAPFITVPKEPQQIYTRAVYSNLPGRVREYEIRPGMKTEAVAGI